ncbi:MAG: hypothetical protein ABL901_10150 [Hyphomicrobiaceae bacterium]
MNSLTNALPPEGAFISAPRQGVVEECFDAVMDSWLADDMASVSYRHIHTWSDDGEMVQ